MVLVGEGSVRDSVPIIAGCVVLGAVVGIVGAAAVVVSDPESASDVIGFGFVVFVAAACGLAAGVYWFLWVLGSAGRVRYYVDGRSVVVCRGKRMIVRRQMGTASKIGVNGYINLWRGVLRVGPRWPSKSGLPHVFYTEPSTPWFFDDYELPDIFIWGRSGAEEFREALFEELAKAGIDPAVFVRD